MNVIGKWLRLYRRLQFCLRRAEAAQALDDELAFHQDMKQRDNERAGYERNVAHDLSRKQMGNVTLAREESRESWGFLRLDRFVADLRYAVRSFAKTPLFTSITVLSLAVGIGGSLAVFSLIDALLIRPLPYRAPDRLVRITGTYPRAALDFFRARSRSMRIAAVSTGSEFNLIKAGTTFRVMASAVSPDLFDLLGTQVAIGRSFRQQEDLPGRDHVIILSASLWKEKFASDPGIVGQMVSLDGVERQIAGIMPADFSFPSGAVKVWIPMRLDPSNFLEYWSGEFVPFIGRLQPGFKLQAAQHEIRTMLEQFRGTFPYPMAREWNADATAVSLQDDLTGPVRGKLMALSAAVALILLITSVNVAGLLLARAMTRRKEIALRAALGAGRKRIIRQLLTEGLALSSGGSIAGVLLGASTVSVFMSILPSTTPRLTHISLDWHIVLLFVALMLGAAVAFGITPAISASQIDLADAMKTGSRRSVDRNWTRSRMALIAAEVALTFVLAVGAGLLIKSLYLLSRVHTGFDAANIITVRITPTQAFCAQRAACAALYQRLLDQVRQTPGVLDAAVANAVPLDGQLPTIAVDIDGHPKSVDHPAPMLWSGAVSPGYLELLRVPLLSGRMLHAGDGADSESVVLVSLTAARRLWPGESVLGKHIKPSNENKWRTVVGIVADVRQFSLRKGLPEWVPGAVYMPYAQAVTEAGKIPAAMTLVVKVRSEAPMLKQEIERLARSLNPAIPAGNAEMLSNIVGSSISEFRSLMWLFVVFAATAVFLASIGIYGLVSYWVSQRRHEIGLRMAIGAKRGRILLMILNQGAQIALCGACAGIFAALLGTRLLASLLYDVAPADASIFAFVTLLMIAIALAGAAIPAARAARMDPVRSLRIE
ncbi:MAG TPA: ABC transporter permease [Bryobacteraceae bacterium]